VVSIRSGTVGYSSAACESLTIEENDSTDRFLGLVPCLPMPDLCALPAEYMKPNVKRILLL
jgi:hypothetical protein